MNIRDFEIIDFHTHPFLESGTNICSHKEYCNMSADSTVATMKELGVSKICGSVIAFDGRVTKENVWECLKDHNQEALKLREKYGDFYIPGIHVHPHFVKESCEEMEKMKKLGINLVGELIPYAHFWTDYSCKEFSEILDAAESLNMVVSFHSMPNEDEMDKMVREHKNVVFVAAHPGEYGAFMRHVERMKLSENYYLDVSGYGIFRHGMLRHAIDAFGAERILYGSDYPTCNPAMYIGGVLLDSLISDSEKELIFAKNAKRLLGLK